MSTPVIRVTFVDSSNGALLGVVDLSSSRLPRSFAVATTIHLGDDDWEVVRAEPATADEFEAKRELRLEMRHVVPMPKATDAISPNKVLFSVPSIADALPASTEPRGTRDVFEIDEDDWRQIEMVHIDALERVQSEFRAIENVLSNERSGVGFRTCHARRAVEAPLAGTSLSLSQLRSAFNQVAKDFAGLAFRGRDTVVDHGFAFRTAAGLVVYGIAPESRVTVLGLMPDRSRRGPPIDAAALGSLRNAHALLLVDWCARVAVQPARN